MTDLLTRARAQLDSGEPHAVRRACWLTRAALEERVQALLAAKGISAAGASERSRLTCLEGAYPENRELSGRAEYAWSRLSETCHQHAYHLAPTRAEASHLIEVVEWLRIGAEPAASGDT